MSFAHPDGKTKRKIKRIVVSREGGANALRCHYCKTPLLVSVEPPHPRAFTLDHIIPKSKGGTYAPGNVVPACPRCNNIRGNIPYEIFLAKMDRKTA